MPYWAVVRSAPNHERLAAEGVALVGFETFIPRIRVKTGARWRTTPLFGSYFFVRIIDRWRVLERTAGVLSVVKFGAAPARCPDSEIAKLITRTDADGIIRLTSRSPSPPPRRIFTPGAAVAITDGPFRGLSGVYAGMSARERELVLLNVLGAQRPVEVAADLIAPSQ